MLTRLATVMTDFNIWLDRLSNWQFVAVVVSVNVVAYALGLWALELTSKHVNLRTFATFAVLETALQTVLMAWKRWR